MSPLTTPQICAAVALSGVGLAARARRVVQASQSSEGPRSATETAAAARLSALLEHYADPIDFRVRGGLGSGRHTVATALQVRLGLKAVIEDIDELAGPGAASMTATSAAPDMEILCLATAPCRHEERWIARPRAHPLLVVATHQEDRATRASWTRAPGFECIDAREPNAPGGDRLAEWCERAAAAKVQVRSLRLWAELERMAADPVSGELADLALCAGESSDDPEGASLQCTP